MIYPKKDGKARRLLVVRRDSDEAAGLASFAVTSMSQSVYAHVDEFIPIPSNTVRVFRKQSFSREAGLKTSVLLQATWLFQPEITR
ncbi:hypothetical protein AB4Y36_30165 [Paraburkholderia sp. BR10936]|uniref:hypothetical protein n=1 Tax=Paraburkholderia sp. BR10936 TaxID=3236993 RepID=UPI0034D34AB3